LSRKDHTKKVHLKPVEITNATSLTILDAVIAVSRLSKHTNPTYIASVEDTLGLDLPETIEVELSDERAEVGVLEKARDDLGGEVLSILDHKGVAQITPGSCTVDTRRANAACEGLKCKSLCSAKMDSPIEGGQLLII
jgi:hypothetical protein